jgi:hypothetical protein
LLDFDFRKARIGYPKTGGELRERNQVLSRVGGFKLRLKTADSSALHMIVPAEGSEYLPCIFNREEIDRLLRYLRSRYEWVIIDTPPITSATDSLILAPLVDAVLFVIKRNLINKKIVRGSLATLQEINAKIACTVINDFGLQKTIPDSGLVRVNAHNWEPPARSLLTYGDRVGNLKRAPVHPQYAVH